MFSAFNAFSIRKCFDLFEVIFLLRLDSLASKSVFVIKFACANLGLKTLAAKVWNSGVVIYLLWLWSVSFFSSSLIFVSQIVFLTKLLTSGILFSTALNAVFVAKLLTSGILLLIQWVLFVFTKSVTSGIFFSNSVFFCLIFSFKTKSLVSILFTWQLIYHTQIFLTASFLTTSLNLLKSRGTGANLSVPNYQLQFLD